MNVSITLRHILFFGVFFLSSDFAWGQLSSPLTQLKTTKNVSVFKNINCDFAPSCPPQWQPKHGSLAYSYISNHWYKMTYTPDNGFVGVDTFQLNYTLIGNAPVDFYEKFRVSVYNSIVTANEDYAQTTLNTPVTLSVLNNDATTAGGLTVSNVVLRDHGTTSINGDNTVTFTPTAGFVGVAHFNYLVCDSLNTCETGSASISVSPTTGPQTDVFHYSTAKNASVTIPLSHAGFSNYQSPQHGTATFQGGFLIQYTPANNYVGLDTMVVVNTSYGPPIYQTLIITILNYASANKYAIDDYAWTPKNLPVTLNVKTNDIGNYTINNATGWIAPNPNQGTIVPNPSVPGQVTFTPANNFSGVATFKYKLGNIYQPLIETGTVYVMVGNMNPSAATFELTTPMDNPLVINYQIPFIGFDFNIIHTPTHGTVELHIGYSTITLNGQTISGYNLLVYNPEAGFSGDDEFDITYCVAATGACSTVKVKVNVEEIVSNPGDFCLADCVWAGDVNNDGVVNNKDLLPLGFWLGEKGAVRDNATLEWYGQGCNNWDNPYAVGAATMDLKHADTDGNGTVTEADTAAIHSFYGKTHNLTPTLLNPNKGLPFSLHLKNTTPPGIGDLVEIEVFLGSTAVPVTNLYGYTFDMSLSPMIVDSLFRMNFFDNSWMAFNAPAISLSKRPRQGRLETAFTRTNGVLASGLGIVGEVGFIVVDIIDGSKLNQPTATLRFSPNYIGENGQIFSSDEITLEIPLDLNKNKQPATAVELSLNPNPTGDYVSLFLNGNNEMQSVRILDIAGKAVYQSGEVAWKTADLSVRDLPTGLYFVQAMTKAGAVTKKLEVIR